MKLNALSTSQRFGLLVGLCALAILVPTSMQTHSAWKNLEATALELKGLAPVMAVQEVIRLTQQHRGLSAGWLAGNEKMGEARLAKRAEVEQAATGVGQKLPVLGADAAAVDKVWQAARGDWSSLGGDLQARKVDAETSTRRHTALIRKQLDAMDEVLAGAGLVLDPDEGVYHLVVATFQQLPRSLELMGQMRARGSALLAAGGVPEPATGPVSRTSTMCWKARPICSAAA
jgi:hypothetical protein